MKSVSRIAKDLLVRVPKWSVVCLFFLGVGGLNLALGDALVQSARAQSTRTCVVDPYSPMCGEGSTSYCCPAEEGSGSSIICVAEGDPPPCNCTAISTP